MNTSSILSDLSKTVNLSGFIVTGTALKNGDFQIFLERRMHVAKCSCCGRYCGTFYDSKLLSYRDLNWGSTQIFLRIRRVRVDCPICGIKSEQLPFAHFGSPMTKRFQTFLACMCRVMTRADVADLYQVSEDTITRYELAFLDKRYQNDEDLDDLRLLRLDEIARRKGHNYLTVLVNAETGRVVEVVEGRKKDDLQPFFARLGNERASKIEAVSLDMSRSYIAAIETWCENALLVFDRFHIVKHLNDALNEVRKSEKRKEGNKHQDKWRHSKRALGKNEENLTEKEAECLDRLLRENERIFTAYNLKVEFQRLWEYPTKRGANIFLTRWLKKARATEEEAFIGFCDMVERHREGIMNYYFYPLTNGPQEGLNNKINVIRRKAYGYANMVSFILKIFQATDRLFPRWG